MFEFHQFLWQVSTNLWSQEKRSPTILSARLGTASDNLWRRLRLKAQLQRLSDLLLFSFEVPIQQRELSKYVRILCRMRYKIMKKYNTPKAFERKNIMFQLHYAFFTAVSGRETVWDQQSHYLFNPDYARALKPLFVHVRLCILIYI